MCAVCLWTIYTLNCIQNTMNIQVSQSISKSITKDGGLCFSLKKKNAKKRTGKSSIGKGKIIFMSQRNQDRKKLETNAPTELWCPCWQICHPLALHTLYPPHVSPAFRLARTHFILKKKDRSISYSVKKQTKNSSEALRMLYYLYYVPFLTLLQQLPFLTRLPLHNLTIILSKSSGTRVS